MLDNGLRRLFQNPDRILRPYLKPGMAAIDLGCGTGYFTLAMARLAGPGGRVTAVDLQQEMLDAVREKGWREGLADRIRLHRCREDMLDLADQADFVLAFYMVHEVPDPVRFFREVRALLAPGGKFLLVEPFFHVSREDFGQTLDRAGTAGLAVRERPPMLMSRAAVLARDEVPPVP